MLRQALDDADHRQREQALQQQQQQQPTEEQGDHPTADDVPSVLYAAESQEEGDEDDEDGDSDEDDEDEDDDEEGDYLLGMEDEARGPPHFCIRIWTAVKSAFFIIANVENLWDTPPDANQYMPRIRLKRNLIVLFWFVVLSTSLATERSTFKLLVDRAGPFRLFSVEMVTGIHSLLLLLGLSISCWTKQPQLPLGISVVDVGLMALLDTVALLLVFLTGVHVPPTLTVILVQFTLPLIAFLTQFVHPDGRCSCTRSNNNSESNVSSHGNGRESSSTHPPMESSPLFSNNTASSSPMSSHYGSASSPPPRDGAGRTTAGEEGRPLHRAGGLSAAHVWGSLIISIAVLLALLPAFYAIADPDFFIYADTIPIRTAYNTLLYVSSCIPAAASQLYKEHVFLQYKQPVNMTYLNLLLSIFQFIFATIMAPLVFGLQGLGARGDWTKLYPSTDFRENYMDGLKCFVRRLSDKDQEFKYYDDARCDFAMGLVVFHCIAIIGVGVAVDKIVNAGATKVMYRGMSAGIIVAVLCMHAYDMSIEEFSYGPVVDGLNLVCLVLLILGSEVYHRVGLQDATFETVYQTVQTYYEEDYA